MTGGADLARSRREPAADELAPADRKAGECGPERARDDDGEHLPVAELLAEHGGRVPDRLAVEAQRERRREELQRGEEREGEDERELRPDEEPVEEGHVDRRAEEREEVSEDDEERDAESSDVRSAPRSEEHTSELQSPDHLVCRLLLEKKKTK